MLCRQILVSRVRVRESLRESFQAKFARSFRKHNLNFPTFEEADMVGLRSIQNIIKMTNNSNAERIMRMKKLNMKTKTFPFSADESKGLHSIVGVTY